VAKSYLMPRKRAARDRLAITDDAGIPQFEAQGGGRMKHTLVIRDPAGADVAVISGQGFSKRYEIVTGGQVTTVRTRGIFGQRIEINSPIEPLEARANFLATRYSVTRGGVQVAAMARLSIEVADAENPAFMLTLLLAMATIRHGPFWVDTSG